jgi:hypothetical protein
LTLVSAGIFSRKGVFSIQSSLIRSSFFLQAGVEVMLSSSVRSKAETSLLPPFLYGQFPSVAYFKALPIFATFKYSSGFFRVIRSSFVFRKHFCKLSKALEIGLIAMFI